ncbi:MAG TPA: MCE family protein [Nocardioides sp.]|nr:MCE family protein [Nocardioides sp.]
MLVNITHNTPAEHRKLLVAGVAFLTTIALLIGLSIAVYRKAFADVTMITVKADRAGLQLAKFGDVRVNGALVGAVRKVGEDGEEASIQVALLPSAAQEIPENVEVQILPTTLFGQKYLAFVDPDHPSSSSLEEGDVIPSDRVETNVELQKILANLFPLLRAVRPADLNATLNALATALNGRGEELGETLEKLDSYLGAIDDHLPTLRQDLILLADVSDTYADAAPDLIGILRNATTTSQTILEKRQQLDVFFSDIAGLANTSTDILSENETNLIRVGEVTEPVLQLLATYSPEFPCLLKGSANYRPRLASVFQGNMIRQHFVFNTPQYREYDRRDTPVYGEVGHGPWCLGLPNPPEPIPPQPLDDGTPQDDNPPHSTAPRAPFPTGAGTGFAGTPGDQEIINALLADRSGHPADTYGSLGPLMYGPVVRGGGEA